MNGEISLGNLLTILSIVVGLGIQYVAIVKSFGERITKLETKQDGFETETRKDIDNLFKLTRNLLSEMHAVLRNANVPCKEIKDNEIQTS